MQKVPLTVAGAEKMRQEVTKLKHEDRPTVIQSIADAREHGDLKENAEYHAAREQQSFIEGRIRELEDKLGRAQIIDITDMPKTGKVIFGTTVKVEDDDTGEEFSYKIVGDDEADATKRLISVNSPIARALIGKEVDDEAVVQTPGGERVLIVIEVLYV